MNVQIKERIAEIEQGKVPKGYKKVLSSIVCEDYIETTFGELFDFYGGLGIPRDQLSDNGYPYLHYGDMHRESFTKVSVEQYNELPKYDIKLSGNETFLLEDGDVVFLDASEDLEGTSRSVMVDNPENAPFISGLHTFIAKEKHDTLAKDYKQYITMTDYVKKQFMKLASGFKVYGLNRNSIKDIVFTYPQDKQEQQKIAEILMKWDEAIALQEKLIEKLEIQKKALMQKLLTPKEGWKTYRLGDISSMTSGGTPKSTIAEYYDGDIVWVSINDMSSCGKHLYNSERKLTKAGLENSSAKLFPINTILYAMYASIGKCCITKIECSTSQAILGITTSDDVWYEFLYYYLYNLEDKIKLQGQQGTQSNLNKEIVCDFKISIPCIVEQRYISSVLSTLDQIIDLQTKKLAKFKKQQKSLMQLLLTGIVRV